MAAPGPPPVAIGFRQTATAIAIAIGPAAGLPPGPVAIPATLAKKLSVVMVADIKGRFQSGTAPDGTPWPPIEGRLRGGTKPLLDQGILRSSIWGRPETDGATAGTSDKRAPLLHFGGTVRPKTAQFLAVPLTREAQNTGSPRNFPRPLFFVQSRRGNLIMAENPLLAGSGHGKQKKRKLNQYEKLLAKRFEVEGGGHLIPQYALLKSVTIPPRPFVGISPAAGQTCTELVVEWATPGGGP